MDQKQDLIRPGKDTPTVIDDPDIIRRPEKNTPPTFPESPEITAGNLFRGAGKTTEELRFCSGWPTQAETLTGEDMLGKSIENPEIFAPPRNETEWAGEGTKGE